MIETNNPEIDVDEIMVKIREEVAKRRTNATTQSPNRTGPGNTGFAFHWSQIRASLSDAEQNADVGTSFLSMRRFNWAIRWLAKLTGRIVIYLTEVITFPQRRFNQSILHALRITTDGIRHMNQGLAERGNLIEELKKKILYLKTSLVLQERRISMLLEEARKRLPEPFNQEQKQTFANEEIHLLDPLYFFFEDQFRGTREDIKERFKVYLPLVREVEAVIEKHPILDLGCGRGEWLELLKEEGLQARGLETNRILVEQCCERGLDVVEGDAFEYLGKMPDASLGTVTAFHLIEHLPFRELMKLLDEAVRVLKPGGVAIFETPNPENILVGAYNFYFDPTHRNPLPPAMMKFLAESRGLCRVKIIRLHPCELALKVKDDGSELAQRFNEYFYGPQDYGLVGHKV